VEAGAASAGVFGTTEGIPLRKRLFASALATAATVLVFGGLSVAPAMAQGGGGGGGGGGGRPGGPSVSTSGHGTDGTPWTLKSMYDDNSAGAVVVGEEFEINTQVAGQVWAVTFTDNGTAFFTGNVTSTATGVREVQMNLYHGGTSHMAAHAVNRQTGEVVDGSVDLPVAPAACGH
jgi:hypothetical protein